MGAEHNRGPKQASSLAETKGPLQGVDPHYIQVDIYGDRFIQLIGHKETIEAIMKTFPKHGIRVRWNYCSHCG